MSSIDFEDFEPSLDEPAGETIAACDHFIVERWELDAPRAAGEPGAFAIFGVACGAVSCAGRAFERGAFFLVPAAGADVVIQPVRGTAIIVRATLPLP
jgi:hypothetical protein